MNIEHIDISKFRRESTFYGELDLLLTIKNFDLQSIRQRYLKSKKNVSGRAGSIERREVGNGGLATLKLGGSQILNCEVLAQLKEPRGIDRKEGILAFSSENKVFSVSKKEIKEISDSWFSYIHTVDISSDGTKILISSSGFDCIFEYDLLSGEKSSEWFAWENGINKGVDPETGEEVLLTRDKELAKEYVASGFNHLLITDPKNQVLPTAKRAAFINSVVYDKHNLGQGLATFFHEGTVNQIDFKSGNTKVILSDMVKPHGGKNFDSVYLATSTGSGEIILGNHIEQRRFSVVNLPGKPGFLQDMEWLQNTFSANSFLIAIDSNRTSFVILDPENGLYDMIPYDPSWAVQDAVSGNVSEIEKVLIKGVGDRG